MSEHNLPYRDIHSELSSVFSVPQPVDTDIKSIRRQVKSAIPNALDTLLFANGSTRTESATNGKNGAIPLYPATTEGRLAAEPASLRDYQEHETILRSLTDHTYFPVSHVRINASEGAIDDFSLLFVNPEAKTTKAYELHGMLVNPLVPDDKLVEDEFYLVESDGSGLPEEAPIRLDPALAQSLVEAACLQNGADPNKSSLSDKLTYLLERSRAKTIWRTGEYADTSNATLIEARHSEVVDLRRALGRNASRLASYYARIQRATSGPDEVVGVSSSLSIEFDMTDARKYTAFFDMIVNDPHGTLTRDQRTSLFNERFMPYRAQPETFFDDITATLESAASLGGLDQDGFDSPNTG